MLRIPPAIIWGMLLLPVASARADEVAQANAVVRLLNLFASRADALAISNAGKLLSQGNSPAEVVAAELHKPLASLGGWTSTDALHPLANQLGEYVANHPKQFAEGLPNARAILNPLQLGSFFNGLFLPSTRNSAIFQKELGTLSSLLDASWVEAAAGCGSVNLQQLLLIHRGQLRELLLSYQESENDVALIRLGETIANYSDVVRTIEPSGLTTRTLAYLLAGSLGMENLDPAELLIVVEIATEWANGHPELIILLRTLRDPSSLSLLEARLLWQRNEREASLKQLISNSGSGPWIKAQFAMKLFPNASLSDSEAISLVRLLPSEVLVAWVKLSKVGKSDAGLVRVTGLIVSDLRFRDDHKQAPR